MTATLTILRAGPLTTIQDEGRFGMLRHGVSASGPMDRTGFYQADQGGSGAIEFTMAGLEMRLTSGNCRVGFAGGDFACSINGQAVSWPGTAELQGGDVLSVTPGPGGNYGYLRFDKDLDVPRVLGSLATNTRARLGGLDGRALQAGDMIALTGAATAPIVAKPAQQGDEGPIRVVWGLHADMFDRQMLMQFLAAGFKISARLDRMGVRLVDPEGVFAEATILSLVSDAVIPGDIQILGDGTPIVLMRDHQPTGGYPRIATIVNADLDRFAQMRPGTSVAFSSVTVEHARHLLRSRLP